MAEIAIQAAISLVNAAITIVIQENSVAVQLEGKDNPIDVQSVLESITTMLKTMQAYLKDKEGQEGTESSKNRVQQVRDVAYEIEDIVEEFMHDAPEHFHEHRFTKFLHKVAHSSSEKKAVRQLSSRMEAIKEKIKDIKELDAFRVPSLERASGSGGGDEILESYYYPNAKDDELVGIEKHRNNLLDIITNEESRRVVISVVGPRGSGKTTLIKEVYEMAKGSFDCHAWILVPHPGKGLPEKVCEAMELPVLQGTDTRRRLQSYLQQKRYLIFLDGIWSKEEWNCISDVLPNGYHGSRIIISTYKHDIASYCAKPPYNHIYFLNALTWEEGWELFCKKAFRRPKCPQHLVEWSQNILKRCEGLPLAIVSVGSLLSKKSQTPSEFQRLYESLGYELGSNDDLSVMRKILLQSYHRLSHILKCCFLYFCNFSEGCSVTRGRLVRLWIAEGFVEEIGNKTKEEVASDYLNELIYMSLVDVDKRDPEGRVRSCRVHSLVREFINSISEKENFSSVFTRPNTSSGKKPRRLSLQNCCISVERNNFSCVRTLFIFGRDSCDESMAGKLLNSFRLLRVLDFEDAALVTFPEEIVVLTLLRYLSFRNTHIKTIPKSIKKLQNLLTLDLRQTRVTKLPKAIFKLRRLLYLLVVRKDVYQDRAGAEVPSGIGRLTSLQKLSLIKADKNQGMIKELGNLTELRKLGITELKEENGKFLSTSIEKMEQLSSLYVTSTGKEEFLDLDDMRTPPRLIRSLYLGGRLQRIPQWICSLQSVVKVVLKWSKLESSPLEILNALPSLIELHLADAYTREELEFENGWFKELRNLEIEEFSCLQVVVVSEGALPKLQNLVFKRCGSFKVPVGIDRLSQLKELIFYDMPEQLRLITSIDRNTTGIDRPLIDQIPVIHRFSSMNIGAPLFPNLS